jgi:hypothetical protein
MKIEYKTDSGSGTMTARNTKAALAALKTTPAKIADGGWAWAQPAGRSEKREWIARENSR